MASYPWWLQQKPDPAAQVAQMFLGMASEKKPPKRPMLDAGDVVGLQPEQADALYRRIAEDARFEQSLAAEENARQEQQIEGLNERIFRAQDLEMARRDRAQQIAEQRAYEERIRKEERDRAALVGDFMRTPDGGTARVWVDPVTGQVQQQQIFPGQPDTLRGPNGELGMLVNGQWQPVPGAPSPMVASGGSGGGADPAGFFAGLISYQGQDGRLYLAQRSKATGQPEALLMNGTPIEDTPQNRYMLTPQGYAAFPSQGPPVGAPAMIGGEQAQGVQKPQKTRAEEIRDTALSIINNTGEKPESALQMARDLYIGFDEMKAKAEAPPAAPAPAAQPGTGIPAQDADYLVNAFTNALRSALGQRQAQTQPGAAQVQPAQIPLGSAQPITNQPPGPAPAGHTWELFNGQWFLVQEGA